MPYFDPRPKTRREDLYDRERELETLVDGIRRCSPVILLLGLRRTGKTSILNVALTEVRTPRIIIDCRVFEEKTSISHREFLNYFMQEVNSLKARHKTLQQVIERIGWIEIAGIKVRVKGPRRGEILFSQLLESLNNWAQEHSTCIVIGLDEAQELVKLRGIRLLPIIAHAYDYLRNTSFIITGSQVGFLYHFLRIDSPESPLYGRAVLEIKLKPFSKEQSILYLREGFKQHQMHPPIEVLEEAALKLGGIPGWLTMYGHYAVTRKRYNKGLINEVIDKASRIALKEYTNFLKLRPLAAKRYTVILKAVAQGFTEWSKIKKYLEVIEGKTISDSIFTQLLRNLINAGFLEKTSSGEYRIPDPILAHAIEKLRIPRQD